MDSGKSWWRQDHVLMTSLCRCECKIGFGGDYCEVQCKEGLSGKNCDLDVNECLNGIGSKICGSAQFCFNFQGGFACNCSTGAP